jgi:hypothetical protein
MMRKTDVHREAKRLLREITRSPEPTPRLHCEFVRCIVCDALVPIQEATYIYDETGQFYGWECEVHI